MSVRNVLSLLAAGLLAAGCNGPEKANEAAPANGAAAEPEGKAEADSRTIGDALAASADHSALVQALQSAGLIETFRGVGPYTLFAPGNAAFEAMPADARRRLTAADQREQAIGLLSYHVVPGTVTLADMRQAVDRGPGGRAELATVTGDNLRLMREGDAILIEDGQGGRARIVAPDQIQSNGVIHGIDAVLRPGG